MISIYGGEMVVEDFLRGNGITMETDRRKKRLCITTVWSAWNQPQ